MASPEKSYVDFDIADIVLNGVQTKDKFKFSIWQGNLSLNIVADGEFKPKWKQNVNRDLLFIIADEMNKLRAMGPESMIPITVSKWDNEARKFNTLYVLKLAKDDKLVYTLEIIAEGINAKFIFRGAAGITIGSEPMSDTVKSGSQYRSVYEYLSREVPLLLNITRRKWDGGDKAGGNNSYKRPAADTRGPAPANAADEPSEFF